MHLLKQQPEDFMVEEVTTVRPQEEGQFALFWMTKKHLNTEDALQRIVNRLQIPRKMIGAAGNKDRTAVTKQLISIHAVVKERAEKLNIMNLKLEFYGYSDKPLSLGDLKGNAFRIIVRNLNPWEKPKPLNKMVNYFGEQRFSTHNADIGKLLVKKDFKQAMKLIVESKSHVSRQIEEHLKRRKNDYVGALHKIPKKILKLYVHSYQAKLFNELAEHCIEHKLRFEKLPLAGFGTEVKGKIEELMQKIMKREEIGFRDFIIREMPELSSEGGERDLHAEIQKLKIGAVEDDELNLKKKKILLEFTLPKGSYATEAVRQMMD